MSTLWFDVTHALRSLRKSPGYTAVAVVTLALGIGANTTIFSVIEGVLLRPLPFPEAGQIVRIFGHQTNVTSATSGTISYGNFVDLREAESFVRFSAFDEWEATLLTDREPTRIPGASVNAAFFEVLGVEPAVGRFFLPSDDETGHPDQIVISHELWQTRFDGNPDAVGQTMTLNDLSYEIVGVAPGGFEDPGLQGRRWRNPQMWRVTPSYFDTMREIRSGRSFTAIGRIRAGVSVDAAEAELQTIMARLATAYPQDNQDRSVRLETLKDQLVGDVRPALTILLVAVGLVLCIACANVANLSLARAADRSREMAVRSALGASRRGLLRYALVESGLLAVGGAVAGTAVAWSSLQGVEWLVGHVLPRIDAIGLSLPVLGFTVGVTMLSALAFGLAPAWQQSRADVQLALKDGGRGATVSRSTHRMRASLVVAEVALSTVLLIGAGLLIKSFWQLSQTDAGLNPENVLTFEISPAARNHPGAPGALRLYDELVPHLAAVPGVRSVAGVNILPMSGSFSCDGTGRADRPPPAPGESKCTEVRQITLDFFGTLGIPLQRGRLFTAADDSASPRVAVINQTTARLFYPDEDPIGKPLSVHDAAWEIVGIVGDVRQFGLIEEVQPATYLPHAQSPVRGLEIVVRTETTPRAVVPAVRNAIWEIDPTIPITEIRPMTTVVAATVQEPRFQMLLLGGFAAVALVLSAVGIAGVMAYSVTQRRHELGVRLALGARGADVRRLVLARGAWLTGLGIVMGLTGAVAATSTLRALLHGVTATDPWVFAAVPAVLAAVALLASYIPALRAGRVDPLTTLRD